MGLTKTHGFCNFPKMYELFEKYQQSFIVAWTWTADFNVILLHSEDFVLPWATLEWAWTALFDAICCDPALLADLGRNMVSIF